MRKNLKIAKWLRDMDERTQNMWFRITIQKWGGTSANLAKAFYQGNLSQNEIDIAKAFLDDRDFDAGRILATSNTHVNINTHINVSTNEPYSWLYY